jgi:S1-C subfamily serine protease
VDINTTIDYGQAAGAGTGIVLTSNGEILTNNHVVAGATSIKVTDVANGKTYTATVVGYDTAKDIAVLQLHGATGLKTATIASSGTVTPGEQVVAVGNANGTGGTPSYAGGTVVATDQSLTASDSLSGTSERLTGMIEINSDVVPGDSGGPLVNTTGAVIGIDTAGSSTFRFGGPTSGTQAYAVPINVAVSVANQIAAKTTSSTIHIGPTAFLGVEVAASASAGTSGFGGFGSSPTANGVTISGVVANSPAAKAGLTGGDVITAIDSHTLTTATSLTNVLVQDETPGTSVQVHYTDANGQTQTATVALTTGPAQ